MSLAGRFERQHLCHGSALQGDDAADKHSAIDTAPSYSPDGGKSASNPTAAVIRRSISWRQPAERRSASAFGDGTYSTPVWSPRGDYIAFTKQAGGKFAIGVMKPDGSGERILTEGSTTKDRLSRRTAVSSCLSATTAAMPGPSLFTIDIAGRNQREVPTPSYRLRPCLVALLS